MSTGYRIYDQQGTYFLTCTIVDWVDLFSRKRYRDIVVESLRYCCTHKGLVINGFVIMTNHVHLIARAEGNGLSAVMRDFKKFTAVEMLKAIQQEPESRREWMLHRFGWNGAIRSTNEQYQVWTHDNHAVEIRSEDFMRQKLHYTRQSGARWLGRKSGRLGIFFCAGVYGFGMLFAGDACVVDLLQSERVRPSLRRRRLRVGTWLVRLAVFRLLFAVAV